MLGSKNTRKFVTRPVAQPAANRAKLWREPSFGNAEMLRAEYLTHRFPPHAHDGFAIGFVERGAQDFVYVAGDRVVMPEGTICVINPGAVHEGGPATELGWDYRMLYVGRLQLERLLIDADGTAVARGLYFPATVIDDAATMRLIHDAHAASESGEATRLEIGSRLTSALFQLAMRHGQTSQPVHLGTSIPTAVRRAREYIDAHVTTNPSLDMLAAVAGVSAFHLVREFKKALGFPPHAYLIQRRVELAKHLLLRGQPLRRVAVELGYCDQSHLSREFSRFFGVPPAAARF